MLNYVQILFFTLAVLAILAISDRGAARSAMDIIPVSSGCYTIASKKTCPPEIRGYVPVSAGPDDVFFIDPFGNITGPGQLQQQQQQTIQQGETGKDGKLHVNPTQQHHNNPNQPTGQGGALQYGP